MYQWYSIQLSLNTRPLIWLSDWHATKAFLILSVIQLTACLAFMQLLFTVSTKTGYVCSKSKTKCSSYARDKSPEWSKIYYYFCTINWSCACLYHHYKYAQTETDRHVFVQILKHETILKTIRSICTHTLRVTQAIDWLHPTDNSLYSSNYFLHQLLVRPFLWLSHTYLTVWRTRKKEHQHLVSL